MSAAHGRDHRPAVTVGWMTAVPGDLQGRLARVGTCGRPNRRNRRGWRIEAGGRVSVAAFGKAVVKKCLFPEKILDEICE